MPSLHVGVVATRSGKGWQLTQVHKGIRCLMANENICRKDLKCLLMADELFLALEDKSATGCLKWGDEKVV